MQSALLSLAGSSFDNTFLVLSEVRAISVAEWLAVRHLVCKLDEFYSGLSARRDGFARVR